jgi:hypothetical protein
MEEEDEVDAEVFEHERMQVRVKGWGWLPAARTHCCLALSVPALPTDATPTTR